jgi:osmotically inducible lipoprotein OsmB
MRRLGIALALIAPLGLAACASPDSTTGERTLTGAGVGAAAGAAAGLLTGGFLTKTAVGAAAGAAGGFVYDQIQKQKSQ